MADVTSKRRLTGAFVGVSYKEDGGEFAAADFADGANTPSNSMAGWLDNGYNASLSFNSDTIDVSAWGDFPFKAEEVGFMSIQLTLSMRHGVINTVNDETGNVTASVLQPDVLFMENHMQERKPMRLAIVDNRNIEKPNGFIGTFVITSSEESKELTAAQDHNYTLSYTGGGSGAKRIRNGVIENI